jgi:glutamine cyclotransferase
MKKSIRLFTVVFLILFAFTVVVTSCKKDDSNLTKKEMLTAKSWKLLSSKSNGVADVIEDCQKDDFITFTASGTYTFNPGTNKCYTEDVIESGTWALSSDEKYLIVDSDSASLVELTPSRFTFSMTYDKDIFEATYVSF